MTFINMFVLHDVLPHVVGVKYGVRENGGICEGTFLRFSSSTPGM